MQNLLNIFNVSWLWTWYILLSTLIFEALLNNNLTLTEWTEPSTFSRTSVAHVKDFEWLIKTVLTWESRFEWARRVENIIPHDSEWNFNSWIKSQVTVTDWIEDPFYNYSLLSIGWVLIVWR